MECVRETYWRIKKKGECMKGITTVVMLTVRQIILPKKGPKYNPQYLNDDQVARWAVKRSTTRRSWSQNPLGLGIILEQTREERIGLKTSRNIDEPQNCVRRNKDFIVWMSTACKNVDHRSKLQKFNFDLTRLVVWPIQGSTICKFLSVVNSHKI